MIARLVAFSVRHAGLVVALAAALMAYGVYMLLRMPFSVFPEFAPSFVVVQTESPGLSAELVETLVTNRVEAAVAGLTGIETLRSQSIPGLSVVTLVFREGTDVHRVRQMVAERLASLAPQFPRGIGPPAMTPLASSASTVLGLGVTSGTRSLMELRTLVDWTLRPHLLAVEGVADVNVFGGDVRQWQIEVDPARLAAYSLALQDVLQAARAALAVPSSGFVEDANQRVVVSAAAQPAGPAALAGAFVAMRGGRPIRIADVATVREGAAPSIGAASIDGQPGVFVMVQGQLGANTLEVTGRLERALEELQPLFAREQVTLHARLFRPANFIETAFGNVRFDVAVGSALVIGVLVLFLFNARTALISAVAIPVSLLAAVVVLGLAGMGLNIMVLAGLAIAVGEVVDDAIIDAENVFRRLREASGTGADPLDVIVRASTEVRASVVYATFIVVLVFLPLLGLSGVAGRLFEPLALAYIAAVLASLAVALTLTPALCALVLARAHLRAEDPPLIRRLKPGYGRMLERVERHPGRVIGAVAGALALSLGALPLLSGEFLPPLREGHYIVHMAALPGTSAQESLRAGDAVAKALLAIDGVKSVAQFVGRAERGADTTGVHYSELEVEVGALPGREQTRVLGEIEALLFAEPPRFPGVAFAINTFLSERIGETVTGLPAQFAVHVFGPDLDALDDHAAAAAAALAEVRGARGVQAVAPQGTPELEVRAQPERLAALGLTSQEIVDAVQAATQGAAAGQVLEGARSFPAAVRLAGAARGAPEQLAEVRLRAADGTYVRIGDVADVALAEGRHRILHIGARRVQTVTANVHGRDLRDFERDARARVQAALQLGPGEYVVFTGQGEEEARARRDLLVHSALAIAAILALLYAALGRMRNVLVMLANLPFALCGGVAAVLLAGGWLSLGATVGFVTLFGITLRNSIMLVSHYQHLVAEEGLPWNVATAIRGAQERLPSILMTALVTGLGLLPLALGTGNPGREIEGPMALVIVGGLATSTLLNLLVLPALLLRFGDFRVSGRQAPATSSAP